MSVNNINLAMSASSYGAYNQRLTQATKSELEKLGIPYDPNITEQEGKSLIAKYKSNKAHNEAAQGNFTKNKEQKDSDLLKRAKDLAEKLGVSYDEGIQLKALLTLIEQALETKINGSQNNEVMLKQLKEFSEELASIQAESMGATFSSSNQALEMSLQMLSLYNQNLVN